MTRTDRFPPSPDAPAWARRALREYLGDRVSEARRADAEVLVTELVSNAVRHGRGEVELRLDLDGSTLRGQVIDQGEGFEADVRERGIDEVGGRGLSITASLSDRWGVFEGSSHVWFELSCGEDGPAAPPELGEPPDEVP